MDEMTKIAEEYDAAGRIMARGFAAELEKLGMPVRRRGKMKKRKAKGRSAANYLFMQN